MIDVIFEGFRYHKPLPNFYKIENPQNPKREITEDLLEDFPKIISLDGIEVAGLMNIAPLTDSESELNKLFSDFSWHNKEWSDKLSLHFFLIRISPCSSCRLRYRHRLRHRQSEPALRQWRNRSWERWNRHHHCRPDCCKWQQKREQPGSGTGPE